MDKLYNDKVLKFVHFLIIVTNMGAPKPPDAHRTDKLYNGKALKFVRSHGVVMGI